MLKTLVMKFGGAALATPNHFCRVARRVKEKFRSDKKLIIVVSAMGQMTDELMELAHKVSPKPLKREQDMLISVGERISMSLLAMALADQGVEAISLTGSQSGIMTSSDHLEACITAVRPLRLKQHLDEGKAVIVAGFQGVSQDKEITTLGRGGSDTTAVALGVACEAEKVEFYKDVPGFYEKDPKKEVDASLFSHLSYKQALTYAKQGSTPLHPRSIFLASKNGIPLHVLSFREDERILFPGTKISDDQIARSSEPIYESIGTGDQSPP
ncbi:aspartate kinase [Simkania sp.]|uniref:amino acid kinase family protein n=1 Tax=Simkania sp. TaxID=34094 RepID=UPI003B5279D1